MKIAGILFGLKQAKECEKKSGAQAAKADVITEHPPRRRGQGGCVDQEGRGVLNKKGMSTKVGVSNNEGMPTKDDPPCRRGWDTGQ